MTTSIGPSLFEQYTRDVYAWAYRLLGRHEDALDVVQDVFLRWAEQCGRRIPDKPRGWLRQVTLNRAIDIRRHRQLGEPHEPVAPPDAHARLAPQPPEALDTLATRQRVSTALAALTDQQRAVIVAKVYDGMTFAEIAAELDLAVSTAKTHYLRALQSLRDRLRPLDDSE